MNFMFHGLVMKGGQLRRKLSFKYGNHELEIASKYTYLGIVFTTGGSFNTAQSTYQDRRKKQFLF